MRRPQHHHDERKARMTKDVDAAAMIEAVSSAPLPMVCALPETYTCSTCRAPIDIRYPAFSICTPCAMRINNEHMAPWREEQRAIARARIAKMKLAMQTTEEGESHAC